MSERISIAEFRVVQAPAVLKAYGLGSCLAISLYDPATRIGGLAHTLLPQHLRGDTGPGRAKYVDAAIRLMVLELVQLGADADRLVAKIAGGANMFESAYLTLMSSIGVRNARAARETLAELGIPLVAEEVGGNRGRTVEFDLASGNLMVYCARENRHTCL